MTSFLYLVLSVFISAGSGFFVQLFLARQLSVYDYGVYTSIINLVNLISPLIAFGVTSFLLKAYSQDRNNAAKWINSVILNFLLTSSIAFIILQTWSFYKNGFEEYFLIYCFFYIYMISNSLNGFTTLAYQIDENYKLLALWKLAPKLLLLLSILMVGSVLRPDIKNVAIAYSLPSILIILVSVHSIKALAKESTLSSDQKRTTTSFSVLRLLKNSYPYGLSGLFYLIYYQSDIIILSYYLDYTEVGYYGFSLVFVTGICLIPSVYFLTFKLKDIHSLAATDRVMLRSLYKKHVKYCTLIGLIFVFIFLISIEPFITLIFNDKYDSALPILYALALYIPFKFLTLNTDSIMLTEGLVETKMKVMAVAALLNISLNIALIPFLSTMGAVTSTILTELFLLASFSLIIHRKL